jgi:hypothetical protein
MRVGRINKTGIYKRGHCSFFPTKDTGTFLPHSKITSENNKKLDLGLSPYEKENLLLFPTVYYNLLDSCEIKSYGATQPVNSISQQTRAKSSLDLATDDIERFS